MNSVKHLPFKENFNETEETPSEIPPINPNNASNKTYKNISILKQVKFLSEYKQKYKNQSRKNNIWFM